MKYCTEILLWLVVPLASPVLEQRLLSLDLVAFLPSESISLTQPSEGNMLVCLCQAESVWPNEGHLDGFWQSRVLVLSTYFSLRPKIAFSRVMRIVFVSFCFVVVLVFLFCYLNLWRTIEKYLYFFLIEMHKYFNPTQILSEM